MGKYTPDHRGSSRLMKGSLFLVCMTLLGLSSANRRIGSSGTDQLFYTGDCSANTCSGCSETSCSPDACVAVTNTDLAMTSSTIDYATPISGATCNSACTASSASICSNLGGMFLGTGIKAAYCTDQFLVIHTTGYPNHDNWLAGIPRPPGGDGEYSVAGVVRTMKAQYQTYKIPLTVTAQAGSNTVHNVLASAELPMSGAVGVTLSGVPIYPALDNVDLLAWAVCESDQCNAHAGKGFDYHYHGDPYGPNCMYADSMYNGTHPMLIGFGVDGYLIFGRYTATTQDYYDTALDTCGGHTHGDYGYHYHSHVEITRGSTGNTFSGAFTAYWAAPKLCWKGDISQISNFWMTGDTQVNYDNTFSTTPNTISTRSDYCFLRPCCGTTTAYTATGISVSVDAANAGVSVACTGSMTSTAATADGSVTSALSSWVGDMASSSTSSSSPASSRCSTFVALALVANWILVK